MRFLAAYAAAALVVIIGLPASAAARADECRPVPEAARVQALLNQFWGQSIELCQLGDPHNSAAAFPDEGVVRASSVWLADIASEFGWFAVTGILAHEWGHMIQGDAEGAAAELHADCLAGVFMRGVGLGSKELKELERISLESGDRPRGDRWYGTGRERRRAVRRGYRGFKRMDARHIAALCPLRVGRKAWSASFSSR